MGIKDMLGSNGIYICDGCRDRIHLNLDQETFDKLKKEINIGDNSHKCYLCNEYSKDGLFVPPEMTANAIEKNIEKMEELYNLYKEGTIFCPKCGYRHDIVTKFIDCPCGTKINSKKYGKSLKMSSTKKFALRQYAKYLRGDTSVPG